MIATWKELVHNRCLSPLVQLFFRCKCSGFNWKLLLIYQNYNVEYYNVFFFFLKTPWLISKRQEELCFVRSVCSFWWLLQCVGHYFHLLIWCDHWTFMVGIFLDFSSVLLTIFWKFSFLPLVFSLVVLDHSCICLVARNVTSNLY